MRCSSEPQPQPKHTSGRTIAPHLSAASTHFWAFSFVGHLAFVFSRVSRTFSGFSDLYRLTSALNLSRSEA